MTDIPGPIAPRHLIVRIVGSVIFLAAVVVLMVTGITERHAWVTFAIAAVIVASVVRSEVSARRESRRRRQAFDTTFHGSLDEVRDVLDVDRLRAVRDGEGQVQAVRQVRQQVPLLTLVQAVDVVRAL